MTFGWADRRELQKYHWLVVRLLTELKSKGKINPHYRQALKNVDVLIKHADIAGNSFNTLDSIASMYGSGDFQSFEKDALKYGINQTIFMSIYGNLLLYQFLTSYSLLENILTALLLGVKYGKNNLVDGTEPLGRLINTVIGSIYPTHGITKEHVDNEFRNALAHGWYYLNNDQLVYFTDASLQSKVKLDLPDLLIKFRKLNLLVVSIIQVVTNADW